MSLENVDTVWLEKGRKTRYLQKQFLGDSVTGREPYSKGTDTYSQPGNTLESPIYLMSNDRDVVLQNYIEGSCI